MIQYPLKDTGGSRAYFRKHLESHRCAHEHLYNKITQHSRLFGVLYNQLKQLFTEELFNE